MIPYTALVCTMQQAYTRTYSYALAPWRKADVMSAWRLVARGAYWLAGVMPPDQSCSSYRFPVSVPRDETSWRAQIRSVRLRLFTEPQGDHRLHPREVCLVPCGFFLVSGEGACDGAG